MNDRPDSSGFAAALCLRIDLANEIVWRGERAIGLRPKTFAVFRCLARRPGQLVTKEELRRAVWPGVAVEDEGIHACIAELRRALGDDAKASRIIETRTRRGYVLHAAVTSPGAEPPRGIVSRAPAVEPPAARAFGRAAELDRLDACLGEAGRGSRQVVFLAGAAGVGKTTLVDAFVRTARARLGELVTARGSCVEHYGAGEAYLPLLEALGQLCAAADGAEIVSLLRRRAPTWLAQMPWLVDLDDAEGLRRQASTGGRERMLREMAETLEVLTADRLLVLVLEDLHWSDPSTLTLLASLARRRERARLLVLATYRPSTGWGDDSRLATLVHELRLQGRCRELALHPLTDGAVAEYLSARLPDTAIAPAVTEMLCRRTNGHPLFMVNMVGFWLEQGWLANADGQWRFAVDEAAVAGGVPEDLRPLIERWIDRLDAPDQRLLEVGSVAGAEFAAAEAAAGLDESVSRLEERYAAMVRHAAHLLRAVGHETWPDGTVTARYAFVHALCRDVVYDRIPPGARAGFHRRIGARQRDVHGARAGAIATRLAMHFERGGDRRGAIEFLQLAAQAAGRRYAATEVVEHLSRALTLLDDLPEGAERSRTELGILSALGPALTALRGYGAGEIEAAYSRARALAESLGDTPRLFAALRGLVTLHQHRGDFTTAGRLARALAALARRAADRQLVLKAQQAVGMTSFFLGDFAAALRRLDWCVAHHGVEHDASPRGGSGPCTAVVSHGHAAWALWYLGHPDRAVLRARTALRLAQDLKQPQSEACALFSLADLHQYRLEPLAVLEYVDALLPLASEHGFEFWRMYGTVLQGWALALGGDERGPDLIRDALASLRATGSELARPHFLRLLAEALARTRRPDAGLEAIAEGLAAVDAKGERFRAAELYRLRGDVLCEMHGDGGRRRHPTLVLAEESFRRALDVARRHGARSLELRAAVSLSRLLERSGAHAAAERVIAPVHAWFTEGAATVDARAARALLARLALGATTSAPLGATRSARGPG